MNDEIPVIEPAKVSDSPFEDPSGEMSALSSRIPKLAGGPLTSASKEEYLTYRATGFPIRQALALTNVNQSTLGRWRRSDPDFAMWETEKLPELQSTMGQEVLKLSFMRNMRLALATDFKVLLKAAISLEALTDREMKVLMRIRNMYAPSDLLTITKALEPSSESPNFADLILKITQTRTEVSLEAKRVQSNEGDAPTANIIDVQAKKT